MRSHAGRTLLSTISWLLLMLLPWTSSHAASNYSENFNDAQAQGWTTSNGTWNTAGNRFSNDDIMQATTSAVYNGDTWHTDYTYSVRGISDFAASGNAVGVIYNQVDASNYYEVWFNAQGLIKLQKVIGGTLTVVQTGSYPGFGPDAPVDIEIIRIGSATTVRANATTVFNGVNQAELGAGKIGAAAHFNRAWFDDVSVTLHGGTYSENFDDGQAQGWTTSNGTWNTAGNRFSNDDIMQATTIAVYNGDTWHTDYTYSVRAISDFAASGNAVGVIFNHVDASNYYEVWFNAQGLIKLQKVIGGTLTVVQTGSYPGFGPDAPVDIEIVRSATATTVRANAATIFNGVNQPELGGKIGTAAHFNRAWFDDVSVTGTPQGVSGPAYPRLTAVRVGLANYEVPAVQQDLARFHMALLSYWKGWETGRPVTMQQVVQNIKSMSADPANPTKVFLYVNNGELNDNDGTNDRSHPELTNKVTQMGWWLMANGARVPSVYKPQFFDIVNTTSFTPLDSSGKDWNRWYAEWVYTNYYLPNPSIDGFFTDNVAWRPLVDGDWNRDGTVDSRTNATVAGWFRAGYRNQFDALHQLMPGKVQLANFGDWGEPPAVLDPQYTNMADGGLLEKYIGTETWPIENLGWGVMMDRYRKVMAAAGPAKLVTFLQSGVPTDYKTFRYGLGSCLLDNAYFAFAPSGSYNTTAWFDEFDVDLGYPITPPPTAAWSNGVYRRDFQNGIVLVNPRGNGQRTVNVGAGFHRISGSQDPAVNSGAPAAVSRSRTGTESSCCGTERGETRQERPPPVKAAVC
jgi:hypothetical protein